MMIPFDIRTVAFMFGLLSCLLAGMLMLTGWHLKSIRGIREYALGDMFIGLAFCIGSYYSPLAANDGNMVIEVMAVTFGQSLRINGIRAFNGERPNPRFPFIITIIVAINTYCWVVVHTDTGMRAMTNSVFFCLINLLCIRALSIRTETLVRMAYRLTGGAYAFMALLIALRAIAILQSNSPSDHYYVNHGFLLLISIAQFCAAFGFILMLNYRLAADLEHAASCDSLTGALNRRSLALIAARLCLQLTKQQQPLALIMLDVDHFKSINDRFGHPQGDDVLRRVAELARASIRHSDYLGRYGGEEFCVLLPNATENDALQIAERMRRSIANTPLPTETGDTITCTISIGICDSRHFGLDYETMVNQADKALYYAKQNGRNRTLTVAQLNEFAVTT